MSIALISCGKSKREGIHAAQDLYIGSYFKKTLAYTKKHHDQIYILSAKYGLTKANIMFEGLSIGHRMKAMS